MPGHSYDNTIVAAETNLSIETLLVAVNTLGGPAILDPSTLTKIDIDNPPAGFVLLGAVKEDTPSLMVKRDKYQLKLGLPKALQFEAVIGVDGEFSIEVYCKSNDVVKYALGTDITSIGSLGSFLPLGTTNLKHYALLGVADFLDGSQVVHLLPDCSIKPEVTEAIKPTDANLIKFAYDCYSYISTPSGNQRIVGGRIYFHP